MVQQKQPAKRPSKKEGHRKTAGSPDLFSLAKAHGFGELHFKVDEAAGLTSIIAIHSTALGPALGGCRYYPYESSDAAIRDVIRLARGMSMKAAISNLTLGGGKAVVVKTPEQKDRKRLFEAFGDFVNSLNGRYITAVDSGTCTEDMEIIHTRTNHVTGLPTPGFRSGDPAPLTALGVRCGIQAAVKARYKRDDLHGVHIAIQGVGSVGYLLAKELTALGAKLTVADINHDAVERCCDEFGAQRALVQQIHKIPCQVFSPCAMGGILNDLSIHDLQAHIIAGAANNQLAELRHAALLQEKDILYTPDYVLNAGGLIHVAAQLFHHTEQQARQQVENIYHTLIEIFHQSEQQKCSPAIVADQIALARLKEAELNKE